MSLLLAAQSGATTYTYVGTVAGHVVVQAATSQPYVRTPLYAHAGLSTFAPDIGDNDFGYGLPELYGEFRPERPSLSQRLGSQSDPIDETVASGGSSILVYGFLTPYRIVQVHSNPAAPWSNGVWRLRYETDRDFSEAPSDWELQVYLYRFDSGGQFLEAGGSSLPLSTFNSGYINIPTTWSLSGAEDDFLVVYIRSFINNNSLTPQNYVLVGDDATYLEIPLALTATPTYFVGQTYQQPAIGVAAHSTVTAPHTEVHTVTGAIAAQTTVPAGVKKTAIPSALVATQSDVAAATAFAPGVVTYSYTGVIAGNNSDIAVVTSQHQPPAGIAAQSTVVASTASQAVHSVTGDLSLQSSVPGGVTESHQVVGDVAGQSGISGTYGTSTVRVVSGVIVAQSIVPAAVSVMHVPQADIPPESDIVGDVAEIHVYAGRVDSVSTVTATWLHTLTRDVTVQGQSDLAAATSFELGGQRYAGVIAAHSDVAAETSPAHTYSYVGQTPAQSDMVAATEFYSPVKTLVAQPNITLSTFSSATLTYTQVQRPTEGGGYWALPAVPPRRKAPKPQKPEPVLVHRTIVARPCVTVSRVSRAGLRFRRVMVVSALATTTRVATVTAHYIRRVVGMPPVLPVAVATRLRLRRQIVALPGRTLTSITGQYRLGRRVMRGPAVTVPTVAPAVLTARLQTPEWYAAMDDEFLLLMEAA